MLIKFTGSKRHPYDYTDFFVALLWKIRLLIIALKPIIKFDKFGMVPLYEEKKKECDCTNNKLVLFLSNKIKNKQDHPVLAWRNPEKELNTPHNIFSKWIGEKTNE